MSKSFYWLIVMLIVLVSCNVAPVPKPEGYVRLEYPVPSYSVFISKSCHFEFEYSDQSFIERDSNCWYTIVYPKLKGKLYLTYYSTNAQQLPNLIKQSEKLVYEHTIKASGIKPKLYINKDKNVYGTFYELMGESATNFQFYVTDSAQNYLQGSFYFRAQPKPDSLQPAVDYVKKDLFHLMDTLNWD